ncbi:hypothetical protein WR25_24617 [Diploscapter pachys]|uniref:Dedicator of cytokinesis protein 7 n=1 Tax=Diploscapter pachys TaxID=2018661 RepID=A0A2A2J8D6_9BILA|nr:hypothetical protein WR25_24617 [Diploscapter pachys]
MTLYNGVSKRRVSESFNFDMNPPSLRQLLGLGDKADRILQAAFTATCPIEELFIVIRLEKVLQPCDVSDAAEPYANARDEKMRDKLEANARDYCQRLGTYRMPLGFAVLDLQRVLSNDGSLDRTDMCTSTISTQSSYAQSDMGSGDSESVVSADRISNATFRRIGSGTSASAVLQKVRTPLSKRKLSSNAEDKGLVLSQPIISLSNLQPVTRRINCLFRADADKMTEEEYFKIFAEIRRGHKSSRHKTFPIGLTIQFSGSSCEDIPNCFNPELRPLGAFEQGVPATRIIQEFYPENHYAVNMSYSNSLFIYPKCVNMSSRTGTARNICVRVELMNRDEKPMHAVFPKFAAEGLKSAAHTSVVYHNKNPQLQDEIKLSLPPELNDGHHLLFTFYHISCKTNNKDEPVEYPLGYTWLPLYRDGRLTSGDFALPICIDRPQPPYGYLFPHLNPLPTLKWLDSSKPLFTVTLSAVSSVHSQDEYLERFFVSASSLSSNDKKNPPVNEQTLIKAINGLIKARPQSMIGSLFLVFNDLLSLIAHPPYSDQVSSACFDAIVQLVKLCTMFIETSLDQHGRSLLLVSYIHYFKVAARESTVYSQLCKEIAIEKAKSKTSGGPEDAMLHHIIESVERKSSSGAQQTGNSICNGAVHEQIIALWLRSKGQTRENGYNNSWFFLQLISKSLCEYCSMTGRLSTPRRSRFPDSFLSAIDALSSSVIAELFNQKDFAHSSNLGNHWAFFLRDLLTLMDRTYVFKLIRECIQSITDKINSSSSNSQYLPILIDFMKIINSHEHFVTLNLPFEVNFDSLPLNRGGIERVLTASYELPLFFRQQHFLLSFPLSLLSTLLPSLNSTLLESLLDCLHASMCAHERDMRIADASIRHRISLLYLPLAEIVLNHTELLGKPSGSQLPECRLQPAVIQAMAGINNSSGASKMTLSLPITKKLLCCTFWVLKNMETGQLSNWLVNMPSTRLTKLLQLLNTAVHVFEFSRNSRVTIGKLVKQESLGENVQKQESEEQVRWREGRKVTLATTPINDEVHLEATLCTEISLCVLDIAECLVQAVTSKSTDHLLFALPQVFTLLIQLLSRNQSVSTLDCVFSSIRAFVCKMPALVFEQETEQCGELCVQLLRHCCSRLSAVRSQAAGCLYLLIREAFVGGASLARLKMNITMGLSTLVSQGTSHGVWVNDECLRTSLKTLLTYCENDGTQVRTAAQFSDQVKDLVFNLHRILSDTISMKEHSNDYEMTIDLMYRVAKAYEANPDLKLTWLLNMANLHSERQFFCEAALCTMHAAALSAEYISMTTTNGLCPRGAVDFRAISDNILEECATSDDVLSPDIDGICESGHFTVPGMVALVERSIDLLEKAHMYEMMYPAFKIIEPILFDWHEYGRLSSMHSRIGAAIARIEPTHSLREHPSDLWPSPLQTIDKRRFATYFRVGFYGPMFEELNEKEFIYKEPPFTKLNEISHRLETTYSKRFGTGNVIIIKDSNNVNPQLLDPARAYLQITYVEPYLDKWEKRRRTTHFGRSHKLKRFIYSTPFTMDGRSHGNIRDQMKRRTLLTTLNAFPYVKTRIRVVDKEQSVLQPIEVAIEDIEKKNRELAAAIAQTPPDPKMLQMVVQGCIGTTVNQGPVAVATAFLSDMTLDKRGKPVDSLQNKLRLAFRDFSKKCAEALALNKNLLQQDRSEYQAELEKNYADFTQKLASILGNQFPGQSHSQQGQGQAGGMSASLGSDIIAQLGPATTV